MEDMNDYTIMEQFARDRNLSRKSMMGYRTAVRKYCQYHGKSLVELMEEADQEEEEGVRWKRRKLRHRLMDYRTHIYDTHSPSTARSYFSKMITVYKHFDFELNELPGINAGKREEYVIKHSDLPTREIIQRVLRACDGRMRAIVLFMVSSGSSRQETSSLTVQDFIDATANYTSERTVRGHIYDIWRTADVVPTFKMYRSKTKHHYHTFCTPEATEAIAGNLLINCQHITRKTKLFLYGADTISSAFTAINKGLEIGKVGRCARFRPHMLRKYHASTLYNDGMAKGDIDALQGRSRNRTEAAYFMDDPRVLKEKFMKHMDSVMINYDRREYTVMSEEYKELLADRDGLLAENRRKDEQIKHLQGLLAGGK